MATVFNSLQISSIHRSNAFQYTLIWVICLSILLFFMMGADKHRAKRKKFRVSEAALFLLALLGGALGGWVGMYVFRHKTRHWYFKLFFPIITVLWTAGLLYLNFAFRS